MNRFTYHIVSISNLTLFATPSCCDYNAPQKTVSKHIHTYSNFSTPFDVSSFEQVFFLNKDFDVITISPMNDIFSFILFSIPWRVFLKLLFHILGDIQVAYLAGFLKGVCPNGVVSP